MKIGILGGTFNPVHNGHLAVAETVHSSLDLDKVLLVPSSNPPHKEDEHLLPYEERMHLLELAIVSHPFMEISSLDYTPNEKSYTKNLIKRLREEYPGATFYFIIGADNISQITGWYDHRWLLDNITFVAVTREGYDENSLPVLDYLERIIFVYMEPVNISSSMLRDMLKTGKDISPFIPTPVRDYIIKHHLYS